MWCYWGEIEPFSATLAQDGLAEYDQWGKNPLKHSAVAGNRTRATGRTDSELSHWAIMTDCVYLAWNKFNFNCFTSSIIFKGLMISRWGPLTNFMIWKWWFVTPHLKKTAEWWRSRSLPTRNSFRILNDWKRWVAGDQTAGRVNVCFAAMFLSRRHPWATMVLVFMCMGGSQDGLIGKKLGTAIYGSQVRASLRAGCISGMGL